MLVFSASEPLLGELQSGILTHVEAFTVECSLEVGKVCMPEFSYSHAV